MIRCRKAVLIAVLPLAMSSTVLASAASHPAAGTPVPGNVQVTKDAAITRTNNAVFMLADRSDPNILYLSELELQSGVCRFYISRDRGHTWTRGASPQIAPFNSCGPGTVHPEYMRTQLAQAPDGTLYYAFSDSDPAAGGSRSALLGRSTDQGQTWQTIVIDRAPNATTKAQIELDFIVHIAIDPSNPKRIYVDFRRDYPSGIPGDTRLPDRPYMVVSNDGGLTFGTPHMIANRPVGDDSPWLTTVNGKIYASYLEFPSSSGSGAPPPNTVYVASSSDQGMTWQETKIVSAPIADSVKIFYDSARHRFYLVWDDNQGSNYNVYFASSSDAVNWSKPVRLNDDPTSDMRGHLFPFLSMAPNGRIDVAWYDFRNDPYPPPSDGGIGNRSDIYMTSSFNGGATWTANVKVDDVSSNRLIGDWNNAYYFPEPPALVSTNNAALLAWVDTRNGDDQDGAQDVFFGTVSFPTPVAVSTASYTSGDLVLVGVVVGLGALGAGAGLALLLSARSVRRRIQTTS